MATLVHSLSFSQGSWVSDSLRRWWSSAEFNPLANSSTIVVEQLRTAATERSLTFMNEQRHRLVDVLRRQYKDSGLEMSESVFNLLASPRTMVVTTAHQPNWLGGPAYWLHKLLSTMALADKLTEILPEFQWIPLYWMGSEDHDLAELGHCVINGNRVEWEGERGSNAFGRLVIPSSIQLDFFATLENAPYFAEVHALLRESYQQGYTVAQATRRLAHGLLGEGGWLKFGGKDQFHELNGSKGSWREGYFGSSLVVLDGDDADLKGAFAPVMLDQFDSPGKVAAMVAQRRQELRSDFGIEVDLHIRDWPFFVLDGNERLKPEGRFSANDLHGLPAEKLSPGVALRPLFQEFTLPNVAFVGGGAEQLYWAALKPLFSHYGIPFPLTMLRPSLGWLTPEISKQWLAIGWVWDDLGKSADELESKFWSTIYQKNRSISPFWEEGDFSAWAETKVETVIGSLRGLLLEVDSGMQGALGASKHKMMQDLERLEQLYRKALRRKFKAEHELAQNIIHHFMPSGVPMERVEGMWSSLAYGGPAILKVYLECLSPMDVEDRSKAPWMRFIDLRV